MTSPAPAPPVSIRTAGAADLPTVFRLVGALLAELGEEGDEAGALDVAALAALHRELDGRHVALLAETAPGHAIGVLTLYEAFAIYANGKYGVISEMYVAPGFRGARVGGALLGAAQAHGRLADQRRNLGR